MRTLVITQNITVDGAIEMLGNWFDPAGQDDEMLESTRLHADRGDALVLGRRTFEDFRGYWPRLADDPTGIAAELNDVHKYVVSSTITDPGWQNSTILSGNWLDQVRRLKDGPGGEIGVTGSIRLCHSLIEAGLVDEYRLFVHPVVQGGGRRLFPDGYEIPRLDRVASRPFGNSVTLLQYAAR